MAKKHKKKGLRDAAAVQAEEKEEKITSKGWKIIAAGAVLLALGFFTLTFTDPMGKNWASRLSPFLILGAYAVIAAGILLPDELPEPTSKDNPVPTNPAQ
ncbi:MAG TPA: hypothetical protein DCM05_08775 [Elusimicrobia bacterium]|nr:hypothetical protein [Elusimicrobiota bacterium]